MSEVNLDQHGRRRSVTVAFRVSPEEAQLIDAQVAMSGMTKQDYITARLLNRKVTVVPSSRLQKAAARAHGRGLSRAAPHPRRDGCEP